MRRTAGSGYAKKECGSTALGRGDLYLGEMLNDLEYLFGQLPTGADDETVGTLVPVEGQPGLLEVTAGFFSYSQSSRKKWAGKYVSSDFIFLGGIFFPG